MRIALFVVVAVAVVVAVQFGATLFEVLIALGFMLVAIFLSRPDTRSEQEKVDEQVRDAW